MLGPILFNLFINDLFLFIKKANLSNFAENNTTYTTSKDITSLLKILKSKSKEAINWFETNHMFAYPNKFQAIAVHHSKSINENYTSKVNNTEIESKNFVKLLDIEIDNELLFQKKYCFIMQKSSPSNTRNMQTKNPMDKNEKVILKNC